MGIRKVLMAFLVALVGSRSSADTETLTTQLRGLDAGVIVVGKVRQPPLASMLGRDAEARLRLANRADRKAWETVKSRADWERFRDPRLKALRESLGTFPPVPRDLQVRVTRTTKGDGYTVDNLVYRTRPGLLATANLYRPARPAASMPALVVCHSHQSTKDTSWRQDMGMTWARAGCLVLIPDHVGHGERRQHPFGEEGQHDYHARYDAGIQLHLVGDSLMGWMVWDLMRGVDVLVAQKGIDPKRIFMVSEPAGGGDVAAVAAALDSRFAGVAIQNFGGPQPETAYPLPADTEESFSYAGSGSWESTRNLRRSARDGFLPWLIVASIAPRRVVHHQEFYWDREQDPVWKRLRRVYSLLGANGSLAGSAGQGFVVGSAPENTHWWPINRELLYPLLEHWFAIPNPKKEYSKRLPPEDLRCLTPERQKETKPLHVLAAALGAARGAAARKEFSRDRLRREWTRLLGEVGPAGPPVVRGLPAERERLGTVTVERLHLAVEPGIVVPVLLLLPPRAKGKRLPVVVGMAQQGKQVFVRERAKPIAELLTSGVAVCLPDLRGTGETSPGSERGRRSPATNVSSSELMLGRSLLGGRLRDLRSVLLHLRNHRELDGKRIGLWGDSFEEPNPAGTKFDVPHGAAGRPRQPEPLGGLVAILAALLDEDILAVQVHRGLSDYASALEGPTCFLPHDVVVPGVLATGDLCDVAAALAPRPLRLSGMVDSRNRPLSVEALGKKYEPARAAYAAAKADSRLRLEDGENAARWLMSQLGEGES